MRYFYALSTLIFLVSCSNEQSIKNTDQIDLGVFINFCESMSSLPKEQRIDYRNLYAETALEVAKVKNIEDKVPLFNLAVSKANLATTFVESEAVFDEFLSGKKNKKIDSEQEKRIFYSECLSILKNTEFDKEKREIKEEKNKTTYTNLDGKFVRREEAANFDRSMILYTFICYPEGVKESNDSKRFYQYFMVNGEVEKPNSLHSDWESELFRIEQTYPQCYDEYIKDSEEYKNRDYYYTVEEESDRTLHIIKWNYPGIPKFKEIHTYLKESPLRSCNREGNSPNFKEIFNQKGELISRVTFSEESRPERYSCILDGVNIFMSYDYGDPPRPKNLNIASYKDGRMHGWQKAFYKNGLEINTSSDKPTCWVDGDFDWDNRNNDICNNMKEFNYEEIYKSIRNFQ